MKAYLVGGPGDGQTFEMAVPNGTIILPVINPVPARAVTEQDPAPHWSDPFPGSAKAIYKRTRDTYQGVVVFWFDHEEDM